MTESKKPPPIKIRWYEIGTGCDLLYSHKKTCKEFYLDHNIDRFNKLIGDNPVVIKDDKDDEHIEELFIELEGETKQQTKNRRKGALLCMEKNKQKQHGIKYSDCYVLAFVYAACKQFPQLMIECAHPLLVEQANKFYAKCIPELILAVKRGPVFDPNYQDAASINSREHRYDSCLDNFVKLFQVMYHASGDIIYINTILQCSDLLIEYEIRDEEELKSLTAAIC